MNLSQKIMRWTLFAVLFCNLIAIPVVAAPTSTPATISPSLVGAKMPTAPDPRANPVLADILKLGAKLYYLGNRSGLDGWFIVKDGQIQIAYSTADGQSALIGAMFGSGGENITGDQVKILFDTNPEVKTLLAGAVQPPGAPDKAKDTQILPSPTAALASIPPVTSSGERLYNDLLGARNVIIGTNNSAPLILMVMDPNCPHCQATWRALRDLVFKNTLQIRFIPIGTENTDNERVAAQLLHVADPLNAWNKYVDGDKSQLAGVPDKSLISAVQANHTLVDNWHLQATPVLVYRGKNGKIKIEQGEPEKVTAILSDLAPQVNP